VRGILTANVSAKTCSGAPVQNASRSDQHHVIGYKIRIQNEPQRKITSTGARRHIDFVGGAHSCLYNDRVDITSRSVTSFAHAGHLIQHGPDDNKWSPHARKRARTFPQVELKYIFSSGSIPRNRRFVA